MKKLLSLLSVLTISGTAVPTVIAASPYQKDTSSRCGFNVKNEKIIINNLEKFNRNKRSPVNEGCKTTLETMAYGAAIGATSGAAGGAALGSVMPGGGTVVGAGFGALVGEGVYGAAIGGTVAHSNLNGNTYC